MTAGSDPSGSELGPVVLVGLMASGKSTVGALVADRTGRILIDVDDRIRARTGRTTREVWERGGEAAYRPLERDISLEVLREGGAVVLALPGGAIDEALVRSAIATAGPFTVWLRARPALLAARVAASDHRPLVGEHAEELLERQDRERGPRFAAIAELVVDVDALDADQAATVIVAAFASWPGPMPGG